METIVNIEGKSLLQKPEKSIMLESSRKCANGLLNTNIADSYITAEN